MSDLCTIRKEKGLRIEDLATGLVQPGTIISIENGQRVPRAGTRKKIERITFLKQVLNLIESTIKTN